MVTCLKGLSTKQTWEGRRGSNNCTLLTIIIIADGEQHHQQSLAWLAMRCVLKFSRLEFLGCRSVLGWIEPLWAMLGAGAVDYCWNNERCLNEMWYSWTWIWQFIWMGFAIRVRCAVQKYGPTCHQRDRADSTEFVTLVRLSSLGQHVGVLALAGYINIGNPLWRQALFRPGDAALDRVVAVSKGWDGPNRCSSLY